MERGTIRSISNAGGMIADVQGQSISFGPGGFVGRNRSGLKSGDSVWFERIGARVDARAINIRRC